MNWLITGGAGFIGINTALHLLEKGEKITIFDNFSRKGAELNIALVENYDACTVVRGSVAKEEVVEALVKSVGPDVVLHLAAQVAVTSSIEEPREDFECNLLGTLNMLEAVRKYAPDAVFLNASTNKVYGEIGGATLSEDVGRYSLAGLPQGVSESQPLEFLTPYGCSKGAADQYVIDYNRIYRLRTVTFRQSCIFGPNQYGIEDQGWIAWFTIASVMGEPITIYGDGKQVRDLLYIDDLVELFVKSASRIDEVAGECFNIGGGGDYALSLLEVLKMLEGHVKRKIDVSFDDFRPGDQKVYISDYSKARARLGWRPSISPPEGLERIFAWASGNREKIRRVLCGES
jgi:CDP-paratose 2-epimerase